MTREFTDEEVGLAPASTARSGELSDADVGLTPAASAAGRPSRFGVNLAEGFRGTLLGEAVEESRSGRVLSRGAQAAREELARRLAGAPPGPPDPATAHLRGMTDEQLQRAVEQYEGASARQAETYRTETLPRRAAEAAALPPMDSVGEVASALAGQLVGGTLSPESLLGPARAGLRQAGETAGQFARRATVEGGGTGAVVVGGTDPIIQSGEVERGQREAYDPLETALSAALGGVIGAGIPGSVEVARSLARSLRSLRSRRAASPDAPDVTPDEFAEAWNADPDLRAVLQANGVTGPDDPRVAQVLDRLRARRAAEGERAAVAPSVTETDLRASREAVEGGADPSVVQPPARAPVPDVVALPDQTAQPGPPMRGTADPNAPGVEAGVQGRAQPQGFGALVPTQPQPTRMTPEEVARARAQMEGGRFPEGAEPPGRFTAPEGRAPQTPEQAQAQREADQAFDLAERQRARAGADIRDTQTAGRPEGVAPQTVLLDQGFPVRVIARDDRGFASVQRYDPRTGELDPESVPYVVRERDLETRRYAVEPRRAQDFAERARGPLPPEQPRGPAEDVAREPRQTYRTTPPDPNQDFPGATARPRPGAPGEPPAGSGGPTGRSPLPEQPEGPAPGRRWSSAEEAERAFQARRAQAEAEAEAARQRGEWQEGQRATNMPRGQDGDGRWFTSAGGYVQSDAGGPIRFGDQKQAARWIISQGQARSPDQVFEIAVHPSGQGFTVRETGRAARADGPGAQPGDAAGAAGGRGAADPGVSEPRRLTGPDTPTPGRDAPPAGAAREPASSVAPDAPPASWVVRERATGRVVMETFDRRAVEALNTERYEAVPIGQHLAEVNRTVRAADRNAALARASDSREGITAVDAEMVLPGPLGELAPRTVYGAEAWRDAWERATPAQRDRMQRLAQSALGRGPRANKAGEQLDALRRAVMDEAVVAARREAYGDNLRAADDPDFRRGGESAPEPEPPPQRQGDDITRVSAAKLKTLIDREEVYERELSRKLIEAGYGNERTSETRKRAEAGDPLAREWARASDRLQMLRDEQSARRRWHGSDKPRRAHKSVFGNIDIEPVYLPERLSGKPARTPRRSGDDGPPNLYANPLDPAAIRRFLVDPTLKAVRAFRDTLLHSTAARAIGDHVRLYAASNRAVLTAIADRYAGVPELRQLRDAVATDPGTGNTIRETFQTAADSTAVSYINRTLTALGDAASDTAALGRIRDVLTGKPPRTPDEAARARRLRGLLDEFHDYLKKAGVDLGYVRGRYFPRIYDAEKVLSQADAFKRDAERLYRRMGLDATDAREAAEDWINRLAGVGRGAAEFGHNPVGTSATRNRKLPPDADDIMREWLVTDAGEALQTYFRRATKTAEFTRRFGRNGERYEEMLTAAFEKGVRPADLRFFRTAFESATGTLRSNVSSPAHALTGWIQALGPLAVLPRAALSSLVEGMAIGSRTGNLWTGLTAFADTWRAIARSDSTQDARHAAEMLGIISDALADMRAQAMWDAPGNTKMQRALVGGMFRVTGLHEITNAQRVAGTRIGQVWVRQLLDEVAGSGGRQASARLLLAELGIDEASAPQIRAWLQQGGMTTARLLEDSEPAHLYRTAIRRFVNESIQSPEAVDKPAFANAPVGRLAYGIMSFMFAFTRNVVLRSIKHADTALRDPDLAVADRLRLIGPMMAFAMLSAAQYGASEARERIFNWHRVEERDSWVKTILNLDRAGVFGTFSPLVNMISSAKYERDPSSLVTGPYAAHFLTNIGKMTLGMVPQPIGPNSPRTNNAEHAAVRAFHASVLAPAVSAAASLAPGGPALQTLYGVGTMFATSRAAGSELADATVGERTVQPRTPGSRGAGIRGRSGIAGGGGIRAGGGISAR